MALEPEVDVFENAEEFLIHAVVPGVDPEHIHIEATPHTIALTAEISSEQMDFEAAGSPGSTHHRRSRHADHDRYYFVYALRSTVTPEAATATLRHGIVDIRLPKIQNCPAPVRIPVTLAGDSHDPRPSSLPTSFEAVAIVSAHEGSPRHKLGAMYAPNPGEDHATKARSIGE